MLQKYALEKVLRAERLNYSGTICKPAIITQGFKTGDETFMKTIEWCVSKTEI